MFHILNSCGLPAQLLSDGAFAKKMLKLLREQDLLDMACSEGADHYSIAHDMLENEDFEALFNAHEREIWMLAHNYGIFKMIEIECDMTIPLLKRHMIEECASILIEEITDGIRFGEQKNSRPSM